MSMLLNEEQRLLGETAREFLSARAPVSALRRLRDSRDPLGYDPAVWREVAEMGWTAAVFPETEGGLDFGYKGLGAVFEQAGRTLAALPLLPSVVLGGGLLLAGGDARQRALIAGVIDGSALLALALEEEGRHAPCAVRTTARPDAGGWVLDGEKWFVLDGHVANMLVVVARSAGAPGDSHGLSLFLVDPKAEGVVVQRSLMADSRNAARVRLSGVRLDGAALLGAAGEGFALLEPVLDRARICLAAEALGVISEAFDRTVAYLKERVQFDVAIGSFQALQHRMARLYVDLEMLRSCVGAALDAIDSGSSEVALLGSLAKARAADLSERALNEAVQLHGGIGVTDELDLGLFVKRGRVIQQTFGDGVFHRDRYAQLKGF
ncbi:acyl-CoA dehydrogenase family protein [Massilia cavernae]|uniref:Acyl-CoA dehydrogenase n=1 Tax=Massilia cavernae TaxID=2320864 RepID=A0A418Y0Y3_9BURK|nr:acyl-CoA dehydrogenase [Massilia cavernae]RJG19011.1 acyl-CoA dehydrogenase [Massilia cavernae]